tara:strand:+ start:143 stop:703 length:561 start_codon:yes stop_codon:yes gene_type:complete
MATATKLLPKNVGNCLKMKPGNIVLFNWENPLGTIIRWRNKIKYGESGWTHVGIITEDCGENVRIHEAVSKGFVSSQYPKYWLENKINKGVCLIGTPQQKLHNIKENADKYLGRDYSFTDLFNIMIYWISGKTLFKQTANHLICSEAVTRILYDASKKKIDFEKEYKIPYDLIEPMHIRNSQQVKF